ncbi:MAG: hypothetical protein R2747_19635 [Pyrinomonadaceae bacterium]
MKADEKSRFLIPAAVIIVYIFFRFWHLTDSCLWFDEIFSVHAAEQGWSDLFGFVARDLIHPPLFYVFLKIWILIGGESLFWLRFFPVLFSLLALVPFYLLCRQLKLSPLTVGLALGFLAVNGSLIKYAQEVRMYSLLFCLSLFSLWLFARYLNVGKGIWFLTFVNILLVQTQYFGWFIVFGEVLAVLYLQRIKIGQTLIMVGLTIVGFVPWLIAVWRAAGSNGNFSQNLGWAARPDLTVVFQFIFNLIEPFYYPASNIDPPTNWPVTLPLILLILTASGFYLAGWRERNEKEKNDFAFLLIIILTPVLLALAASWILPFSIWGTRHFIIIFAPLAILGAKFFQRISDVRLRAVLIGSVLAVFLVAFIWQLTRPPQKFIWCGWEDLAAEIPPPASEPTKIYVFEDLIAYQLWFALRKEKNVEIIKVNGIPELKEDPAYFLPRGFDEVKITDQNGLTGEKFYIAFRAGDFNYLKPPLNFLIEKNYRIGRPTTYQAQGQAAFLVEITR